jgi:hypothetical protein
MIHRASPRPPREVAVEGVGDVKDGLAPDHHERVVPLEVEDRIEALFRHDPVGIVEPVPILPTSQRAGFFESRVTIPTSGEPSRKPTASKRGASVKFILHALIQGFAMKIGP